MKQNLNIMKKRLNIWDLLTVLFLGFMVAGTVPWVTVWVVLAPYFLEIVFFVVFEHYKLGEKFKFILWKYSIKLITKQNAAAAKKHTFPLKIKDESLTGGNPGNFISKEDYPLHKRK